MEITGPVGTRIQEVHKRTSLDSQFFSYQARYRQREEPLLAIFCPQPQMRQLPEEMGTNEGKNLWNFEGKDKTILVTQ